MVSYLTMFMAGLDAEFEYNIKQIFYYSTLRQLDGHFVFK